MLSEFHSLAFHLHHRVFRNVLIQKTWSVTSAVHWPIALSPTSLNGSFSKSSVRRSHALPPFGLTFSCRTVTVASRCFGCVRVCVAVGSFGIQGCYRHGMAVWLLSCSVAMCVDTFGFATWRCKTHCNGYIKVPRCGCLRVVIRVGVAASRLRGWFVSRFFQFWRWSCSFKFPLQQCFRFFFALAPRSGFGPTHTAVVKKCNCWAWTANTAWKEVCKCKPEWR